jgi:hypothetical protein
MPVAKNILHKFGCLSYNEKAIFKLVDSCDGDAREIITILQRVALKRISAQTVPSLPVATDL